MLMYRFVIFINFFLLIITAAIGQPAADFHVQQYTTDNGLPSNGIKGLQWNEKTEFLWLATEAGIVRFNGVDFKTYTKENMPAIASERMLFMVRNRAGRLYTSDQQGNIFYIEKSKPVLWLKSPVNSNINPYLSNYFLLEVSERFFKKNAGNVNPPGFSTGFSTIITTSDTSCYILNHGSLYHYSIGLNNPVILPFEKGNISNFFMIGNSYFIRTKNNKTFLFNSITASLLPVAIIAAGAKILKPKAANSNIFWQAGMQNPVFIDGQEAWLLHYEGANLTAKLITAGIPEDAYIKTVQYSKKNKLLFVGTESKGLIVIKENSVQSKKRNDANSTNRNSYYSQIELRNGNILTNEGDIIGNDNTAAGILPIKGKFSFNISQTNGNLLWYTQRNEKLGYNCLYRYNKNTGETKVYDRIKWGDIVASSGTNIYLENFNGIGILEADSLRYLYKYPKGLAGVVTFDFTEISAGILAVANCSGLLRFNTTTHKLDTLFTQENICVRSIWKYKEYVFFGTYGSGFYIYKNGRIKLMPFDKNKYLLYTHCFVPDDEGYCWISTNRGLFKASLDELINAFEKNTSTVYYHYFGKKDGMEMTELNGGCTPCALRLSDKTISFPTMDGLLWVDPQKALPILPDGEIFIDEIQVNNNKLNTDSFNRKELPSQTQEIMCWLGFSAWCNKENIYLDYQLNKTDKWEPVNSSSDALIRLSNLSPGNYVLRIRKLNGFGINNYSYKEIAFTISTPWNKQWWFYLLCCLMVIGLATLYLSWRTRQYKIRQRRLEKQVAEKTKELLEKNEVLEKNNTIKTRLISIISHDIVTPLKFVTVAGKNLIQKRDLMSEYLQQETIREMTNTAQELQLLSTNILNWIKYQNENRRLAKETFNVHELVNQVLGVLNSLAHQKKLKLINNVDTTLEIRQFFEPLKILIYNLLTNAINFSEKGNIIICAKPGDETVVMSVRDEGAGMTPEQIKNIMADQFIISSANIDNRKGNGLGYLIIKDLVKMMNAVLNISSEKGKGTTVQIVLPKFKS